MHFSSLSIKHLCKKIKYRFFLYGLSPAGWSLKSYNLHNYVGPVWREQQPNRQQPLTVTIWIDLNIWLLLSSAIEKDLIAKIYFSRSTLHSFCISFAEKISFSYSEKNQQSLENSKLSGKKIRFRNPLFKILQNRRILV